MTHVNFFFAPALVALIVLAVLLHEHRWRPRPRGGKAREARGAGQAVGSRGAFEVIGRDTGTRYRNMMRCSTILAGVAANQLSRDPFHPRGPQRGSAWMVPRPSARSRSGASAKRSMALLHSVDAALPIVQPR